MFTRELTFEAVRSLPDDAPIPATIASDTPVDRGNFIEVLDCTARGIDLVRAPLPVIVSHESGQLAVGVAENITPRGNRVTADIRFGTSAEARAIRADVLAGIHRSLSVGYELADNGTQVAPSTFKFTWRPHEVSIVSVPADPAAGFFRMMKGSTMSQIETEVQPPLTRSQRIAAHRDEENPYKTNDAAEIASMGQQFKKFGSEPLALEALQRGESARDFSKRLMKHIGESGSSFIPQVGMTGYERRRYSLSKAIEAQLTGDWRNAGLEREAHDELSRQVTHRSVSGLLVPASDLVQNLAEFRQYQKRDMTVATASNGGYLVGTEHRPDLFIDALREQSLVMSMGATRLPGLVGNVDIPRLAGDVTAFWQATETTSLTESNATLGQLLMTPKTIGAYTECSRRLLKQSTPHAEAILINSMTATLAKGIDAAALNGSGASGEPTGLLLASGLGAVTGTSIAWSGILEFEKDVSEASLDLTGGSVGWITTPAIRQLLKGRQKATGYPEYLWQSPDNSMNGYRASATNVCPAGYLIFGDFSEIVVADWGVVEITVNPADLRAGLVGINAWSDVDIGVKHAGAFSVASSVT